MKERPILFSAPMVRAILNGTKTQTRRVVKPQPPEGYAFSGVTTASTDPQQVGKWVWSLGTSGPGPLHRVRCPCGIPGDRLWVRETWTEVAGPCRDEDPEEFRRQRVGVIYRADSPSDILDGTWKPSIFMPRWASRLTLEVTGVRVERLKDISRGDCMAEGCPFPNMAGQTDPVAWYRELWEKINGPDTWELNPWVWVLEFKRIVG